MNIKFLLLTTEGVIIIRKTTR